MVYGLGESTAQRVEHLMRVRELQDATGGFTAFVPWSFQPGGTGIQLPRQTGVDYLRMVALARIVLDNISHVQAGWVTEGPDLAQLALSFGADDFGGVLMEERVVRATGVSYSVTGKDVIHLIRTAGMVPAQRTTQYQLCGQRLAEPGFTARASQCGIRKHPPIASGERHVDGKKRGGCKPPAGVTNA